MSENVKKEPEVVKKIEETFNWTKLCPKCGGPLEWDREIHCEKCALLGDIQQYLVFIDLGVMKLRNRIGLSFKKFQQLKTNYQEENKNEIPDYNL